MKCEADEEEAVAGTGAAKRQKATPYPVTSSHDAERTKDADDSDYVWYYEPQAHALAVEREEGEYNFWE